MSEFRVGDRVEVTGDASLNVGLVGTIIEIGNIDCGVKFDERIKSGHTCKGQCEVGFGWYVYTRFLKLIGEDYNII